MRTKMSLYAEPFMETISIVTQLKATNLHTWTDPKVMQWLILYTDSGILALSAFSFVYGMWSPCCKQKDK